MLKFPMERREGKSTGAVFADRLAGGLFDFRVLGEIEIIDRGQAEDAFPPKNDLGPVRLVVGFFVGI